MVPWGLQSDITRQDRTDGWGRRGCELMKSASLDLHRRTALSIHFSCPSQEQDNTLPSLARHTKLLKQRHRLDSCGSLARGILTAPARRVTPTLL